MLWSSLPFPTASHIACCSSRLCRPSVAYALQVLGNVFEELGGDDCVARSIPHVQSVVKVRSVPVFFSTASALSSVLTGAAWINFRRSRTFLFTLHPFDS